MHLTKFPECIYQGSDSQDIVRRFIAELENTPATARTLMHLSALKYYHRFLTDTSIVQSFTGEVQTLDSVLTDKHPDLAHTIQGRLKSVVSTENKIIKIMDSQKSIDTLRDIIAFRVVIWKKDNKSPNPDNPIMECYSIANSLIEFYSLRGYILCEAEHVNDTIDLSSPRLKEITIPKSSGIIHEYSFGAKDYIRTPKKNGYQSLHLIFRIPYGLTFEVQIRTKSMDQYATEGYADHGVYKETTYTNKLRFDPRKVNIPGYEVDPKTGILLKDTSGFELSRQIFSFE